MKLVAIIGIVIAVVITVVIGLIAYSYSQIQLTLENISYQGLDVSLTPGSISSAIFNGILGNWLSAVLDVVTGVKIGLGFGLSNHGFFPVYIPDVAYDLFVNDIKVGQGQSHIDQTINPGESRGIEDTQDIQFNSLKPAITSIVASEGMINLKVSGTAYFNLLDISVPIPFEQTKQVNVVDELKSKISSYISQNQQYSNSYQPTPTIGTGINIQASAYNVMQGQMVTFSGRLTDANGNAIQNALVNVKRSITLLPDLLLGYTYTDSNGQFSVNWVATQPITSNTAYVYASFDGSSQFSSSRTQNIVIQVSVPQTQIQSQPLTSIQSQSNGSPQVWISPPLTQSGPNSIVRLDVRLMGPGAQYATVDLMQYKGGSYFDSQIESCQTDSYGYCQFKIPLSTMGHYFFYALFPGSSTYGPSKSSNVEVDIGLYG